LGWCFKKETHESEIEEIVGDGDEEEENESLEVEDELSDIDFREDELESSYDL
jgi:hypothetical protein